MVTTSPAYVLWFCLLPTPHYDLCSSSYLSYNRTYASLYIHEIFYKTIHSYWRTLLIRSSSPQNTHYDNIISWSASLRCHGFPAKRISTKKSHYLTLHLFRLQRTVTKLYLGILSYIMKTRSVCNFWELSRASRVNHNFNYWFLYSLGYPNTLNRSFGDCYYPIINSQYCLT